MTGAWEELPRLHVLCSFGLEQLKARAETSPAFRHMTDDGLVFRELPSWHWPMVNRAAELAAILDEVV